MADKHMKTKRGFTIIELLVVISIIGLLTGAAATSFVSAQRRSRDSARKAQVHSIANAVESFYSVKKKFPGLVDIVSSPHNVSPAVGESDGGFAAYNRTYENCQTLEATVPPSYTYYFYPIDSNYIGSNNILKPCYTRANLTNSQGQVIYQQSDYNPYPSWIPGIGEFLNPLPIDKKYQGFDGTETGFFKNLLNANNNFNADPTSINVTRTYAYKRLAGGYIIYTHLESTAADNEALDGSTTPITYTDKPNYSSCNPNNPTTDTCLTVKGQYIYLVRK